MDYLPRVADHIVEDYLGAFGAVLMEGPKWCGKTTTAERHAASVLRLQMPDTRDAYLATAAVRPSLLLDGATPRLIDEWQDAPQLWDAVRTEVDRRQRVGQFLLTGSNAVDRAKIHHTGTGRIARVRMLPMSLWESGDSCGAVSLARLFAGESDAVDGAVSPLDIRQLIFVACRGGWPAALLPATERQQLLVARDYVRSLCQNDISTIDGTGRNAKLAAAILRTYARNISTLAKNTGMLREVAAITGSCTQPTFDSYVSALERLFVVCDLDAWSPAIRSASTVKKGQKRELADPSLAVAALGLSPELLQMDLKTFGFIFECMAVRDLKAYSQAMGGELSFYNDRYGLEADAVLHLDDGRYALIEFKLGSAEIDLGAGHLLEIRELVRKFNAGERQIRLREPDLLLVVTGGQLAYRRPDGVLVVPLACLRD